jgi:hypothetical protein
VFAGASHAATLANNRHQAKLANSVLFQVMCLSWYVPQRKARRTQREVMW